MNQHYQHYRNLSKGAIIYLNNIDVMNNSQILNEKFIFQIIKCVPFINLNFSNCSIFDGENIANNYIIPNNIKEGRLYEGDIVLITKTIINKLDEGGKKLFIFDNIIILEKNAELPININEFNYISSKSKKKIMDKGQVDIINNKIYQEEKNKIIDNNLLERENEDIIMKDNNNKQKKIIENNKN